MLTYKAENNDGLADQMNKDGSSVAFVTAPIQVREIEQYFDGMSVADLVKATDTIQSVEELLGQEQPDLALVVAILVSTGWNDNDDIFTPTELWKARSSPLHKSMNDNHQGDRILGHIVKTRVLDKSGNEIVLSGDETPPSEFDIEVAGVLYKGIPALSDRIEEIIAKAKTGDMFVSMECWFPDFGYGFIDPKTGSTKLMERNESTAFLTKHLRIYGGSGKYQGYKIGRVMKDLVFGAQGFTEHPANPESVIKVVASKIVASGTYVKAELSELLEGGVEDVDEKQLKELQTKFEEAQASLEGKTKEVADLQKTANDFRAKDYDGQITTLNTKVEELTISVADASEKTGVVEAAKVELQKQLDEVTKRAEKSEAELDDIQKNEVARDRLAKLSKVKKVEDEEATLAELHSMTNETFDIVLKYAGETKSDEKLDTKGQADKKVEQAEAALGDVKEDNSADFNTSEDKNEVKKEGWVSLANALTGHEEKDKGGE